MIRLNKVTVILSITVALALSASAKLKMPAVFSDNMVLQSDQKVAVWGWADAGQSVEVVFAGQTKSAKGDKTGKFMVQFDPMPVSKKGRSLTVKAGGEKAEIKNVLVGEVWICSGQSNMQMSVNRSKDFEKEKAEAARYPLIRMFLTTLKADIEPQKDCSGSWKVCSPETVGAFSATAYFFGRKIHQDLDVPVGLIRTCWGGTGIEAWSPMDSLKKYPSVMEYKAKMDKRAETFDADLAEKQYAKKLADWKAKVKQAKAAGKKPPRRPRKSIHPHKDQNYPANLYNAMIHPLVPYTIRGGIWYQGEHNARYHQMATLYRDLMENLVVEWRKLWGTEFPFYAVQLVNYRKPQVTPVEEKSGWAVIRESFLKFHKEVPGCGIAVGIDVGEAKDIHPKNKQAIGLRLAHQALAKTYGKDVVPGGPIYNGMKVQGGSIVLSFDDIGSGLMAKDGELKRFAIAGADKKFVEAKAVIKGNTVVVSSPDVKEPAAVRYAWADNPTGCNLYNKEGFPASPFRTDNWPFD